MSIAFQKVTRDVLPKNKAGSISQFREAIEAAIADPDIAVEIRDLTGAQANSLYSQTLRNSAGKFAGQVKVSRQRQSDDAYTCWIVAVAS